MYITHGFGDVWVEGFAFAHEAADVLVFLHEALQFCHTERNGRASRMRNDGQRKLLRERGLSSCLTKRLERRTCVDESIENIVKAYLHPCLVMCVCAYDDGKRSQSKKKVKEGETNQRARNHAAQHDNTTWPINSLTSPVTQLK